MTLEELEKRLARLENAITITPESIALNANVHMRGNLVLNGVKIFAGAGAPSFPAPNGSLYLNRTGGGGSTLYVRVAGGWFAET